jgi:2-polyprenyl-6-methoxyphenol hydroxylase-like FAD-dependent oxidoreductase
MAAARSALVVGGGIVGLVAARALALQGIETKLLERRAKIEDDGGIGIGIQNNAMNALGAIGLAERCVGDGVGVDTITTYAPNGMQLRERATERYFDSAWPGYTGMTRAALHAILAEGAREAGVELVTSAAVAEVHQAGEWAEARLGDGRATRADVIVGADGIYSTVRGLLFPEQAGARPMGEAVWRARLPGVRRQQIEMMFGGGVGTIGYTPLPKDTYLYVVDRADKAPPRDAADLADRLRALLEPFPGFVPTLREHISDLPGDVTWRRLETASFTEPWHRGRAVIIGDAAHAGPPTLAQGAAMGIEDGVVLAECFAGSSAVEDAFAEFMRRRYRRVRTIVDASITLSTAQMDPDGRQRMAEAERAAAEVLAQPI